MTYKTPLDPIEGPFSPAFSAAAWAGRHGGSLMQEGWP